MKESLRERIMTVYPEWHNYPLRLSVFEIEKPVSVVKSFFESYNLPTIRACLKEWLEDALSDPDVQAKDHIHTHNDVEKLVEAVFVLHKKKDKKKKK